MNKYVLTILLPAFTFLSAVPVRAQEIITPPMFVKPLLMKQIKQLEADIINTQRQNTADEAVIKDLSTQSAALAAEVEKIKAFSDVDQFSKLKEVLANYDQQISLRDSLLAERDNTIALLRQRVEALEKASVITQEMNAAQPVVNVAVDKALDQKKDILEMQKSLLEEKSRQLQDLKALLAATKDELARVKNAATVAVTEESVPEIHVIAKKAKTENVAPQVMEITTSPIVIESNNKELNETKAELARVRKLYEEALNKASPVQEVISNGTKAVMEVVTSPIVIESKNKELNETKAELARVRKLYEEAVSKNTKPQSQVVEIESSPIVVQNMNAQAEKISAVEKSLREKDEAISKIQLLAAQKDLQIANLKKELAAAKDETNKLKGELTKDDEAFTRLKEAGLAMRKEIEDRNDALADKDEYMAELKSQLVSALNSVDANKANLQEQSIKLNEQSAKVQELSARLNTNAEQASNLQNALQSKERDLSALNERLNLSAELSAKRLQRIELINEKNRLVMVRAEQIRKNAADAVAKTVKDNEARIAWLQNDLKRKNDEKEDAYKLLERFKTRLKESEDVTNEQGKNTASLKARLEELEANLVKAQSASYDSAFNTKHMTQEIARLKEENRLALQESSAKDLSLSLVQASVDEKTKVYSALVAQLKSEIKQLTDELTAVQERLTVAESKLKQTNDAQSGEVTRLQDMLKASREEIVMVNALLQEKSIQMEMLQKNLDKNSRDYDQQDKDINTVRKEIEKQNARVAKFVEDLRWKDKEIARLKQQLKGKPKAQVDEDDKRIKELTAELRKAQDKLNTVTRREDRSQLKESLGDARQQIQALKQELKQKQYNAAKNDPAFMQLKDEIKSLIESLGKVETENANLKNELAEAKDDLEACQLELGIFAKPRKPAASKLIP
jgi:chromosome segregation ATPase